MTPVPPTRRGACPAFLSPMETGDGLILRLVPADGTLATAQVRGLAAAAIAFGSGLMEVTARGSLQVRGLRRETVAPLQEATWALGITPRLGLAIDVSPLSGLDPREIADGRPLADAIRAGAAALADRLGPKVSVVIDGGGAIRLDGRKADVRLVAMRPESDVLWSVAIGDGAAVLLPEAEAAARTVAALAGLAALGRAARATDLPGGAASPRLAATARSPIGLLPLADGSLACGIGLPFGAADAATFTALADAVDAAGARDLRPAPERGLIATGLDAAGARAFAEAAERLGCLVRADDPRAFIAACPGAPACASAHFPSRQLAPAVAQALGPLLDGSVTVHLSACSKGCAHPAPATLAFVGMDARVALVHEGAASQAAGPLRPADTLAADLAALAEGAIRVRRPGETGREALRRMAVADLWASKGHLKAMIET